MKRQFLLLAALCLAAAQTWGQEVIASGTCGAEGDNLTWTLTADSTLTISGTGAMKDYTYYIDDAPWYGNRYSIRTCTIADGVTTIGNYAFDECDSLTSVAIPGSVTSIGDDAFWFCDILPSVDIPGSVKSIGKSAFAYCPALASVTLGNGVESIGDEAFAYCESLASITIPASVTSIGSLAFYDCDRLASISVDEANAAYRSLDGVLYDKDMTTLLICPAGRQGAYAVPDGVTVIGDNAFNFCEGLTSVTFPESLTAIGDEAFAACYSLISVIIPDGVTTIGEGAFKFCDGLTTVTIGNGVTSIGDWAFDTCTNLASLTIGSGVASIGDNAFRLCEALTGITCHAATPPAIESRTFYMVERTIPVYVPAGSIEAYRAAEYWSEFADYRPIGTTGIAAPSLAERITVKDGEIHINITGINEVRVYDLQGRPVLSTTEKSFALPQGVYIIKVGDEAIPLIP